MIIKHRALLAAVLQLLAPTLLAAVPLRWTVETNRVQPAQFEAYHGEALEFEATFNSLGKPLALESHTATLYYQTNGMDQAWWSVPGSVSGNVARAVFTPSMDPAAKQITVFLGVSAGPSNQNYRANASVRFRNSPGAAPGWIEPPVVKLDFSTIETLNAPWFTKDESNGRYYSKSETDGLIGTATNGLERASHAAATYETQAHAAATYQPKGSYLTTESDPTVSSAISTHNSSTSAHSDIRTAISGKQDTISDLSTIRSGAAAGATAVQPASISDMETQTHAAQTYQPKGNYLTSESDPTVSSAISTHNSSTSAHSDIRTALANKQPIISDLATIRTGATLGATAVQSSAISDMETQTHAAQTYQPKGSYLTSESDPTVSSWAKATTKPSYTWTEIGSKPTWIGSSKPSYTWSEIGSKPTIPTDSTVSGWGYLKSESDPTVDTKLAPITTVVNAWQTYWDGDDVRVTVTNYYGSQDLPSLYIEQKITEGGTNYYKTIWTEKARLNVILDRLLQLEADVDTKADRAWGFYDSHSGSWAPDGFTSISSGSILVSKDMSYQKTVTSAGEVWVLTATDPTVITGTETNGFFRISDSEGNSIFEVVKGDKRTVPATFSAANYGNSSFTVTFNVVSSEHPTIEVCDDLTDQNWIAEGEAGFPATVAWSGASGAWVATFTGIQTMDKMFVKGTYEVGGETYARHGVPLGVDRVVIGGVYYRVAVETVNGKKLMVLTEL